MSTMWDVTPDVWHQYGITLIVKLFLGGSSRKLGAGFRSTRQVGIAKVILIDVIVLLSGNVGELPNSGS